MKRPAWAGAPGFAFVWSSLERRWRGDYPELFSGVLEPEQFNADETHEISREQSRLMMRSLQKARVITIDPEQANQIPPLWGCGESEHYGGRCAGEGLHYDAFQEEFAALRLPFESVFLDFGGMDIAGILGGGHLWGVIFKADDGVSFNADGVHTIAYPFVTRPGGLASVLPIALSSQRVPGKTLAIVSESGFEGVRGEEIAEMGGLHLADGVERGVAALRWLESVNVSLQPMRLTGKAQKRAARKGQQIPLTVTVRQPKQTSKRDPSGERANYSHRFEVRGHYMHFSHGPIFDATEPANICDVPGIGPCRRVWCPPHVKGPQDRPLVVKRREVVHESSGHRSQSPQRVDSA